MKNLVYRIKTKPGYKYIGFLLAIVGLSYLLHLTDPYYDVMNNKADLQCEFADGRVEIVDPNLVTGYIDEEDVWTFKNGYSHNCKLLYKGVNNE